MPPDKRVQPTLQFAGVMVVCALLGCAEKMTDERWYEQGQVPQAEWERAGLGFVKELISRDFADAHRMLGSELQKSLTAKHLEAATQLLVSEQFVKMDDPRVLWSMERWPDKQSTDLGMSYVHIGGDHNEAITVTICLEAGKFRVREIAWGRP